MAGGPAIAIFDRGDRIVSRNEADATLFGAGGHGDILLHRFHDPREAQALLDELRGGRGASACLRCRTAGGERLLHIGALPVPFPAPETAGENAVFCFHDAGPQKPDVPSIPVDRLARLGHELRSPLNAVLGFAEMIRHPAGDPAMQGARAADYAGDIVSAAWRLLRLADDLVALGELGTSTQMLRMGEVDLGRIVRRLVRLARPAADSAGVRIDDSGVLPKGAGPVMLGDEGALWSAIDNLLQNAIRYGGEAGCVTIAFREPGPGDGVLIEVADDGAGLTPEELAHALSPYGRPAGLQPGNRRPGGLGLPIARDLIEAHDGRLEIRTAPGQGFRAFVSFPVSRCLED